MAIVRSVSSKLFPGAMLHSIAFVSTPLTFIETISRPRTVGVRLRFGK